MQFNKKRRKHVLFAVLRHFVNQDISLNRELPVSFLLNLNAWLSLLHI